MKTTSLETSRRLAGKVNIETEYWWQIIGDRKPRLVTGTNTGDADKNDITNWIPAYTTDELMEWLPESANGGWFQLDKVSDGTWAVEYSAHSERADGVRYQQHESLPEALALLAEYLVDNGIYPAKQ